MRDIRVRDRGEHYSYPYAVEVRRRFLWWAWWGFYTARCTREEAIRIAECLREDQVVWP